MKKIAIVLCVSLWLGYCFAADKSVITNLGFENLDDSGAPVDWEIPSSGKVKVSSQEKHSGKYSLHMKAESADKGWVGFNRSWKFKSGEQGTMISEIKGTIKFWYKAVSAKRTSLWVGVIPITKETTESPVGRTGYLIPEKHIGDGKWHEGKVSYDYSGDKITKWIHISARAKEGGDGEGEFHIDDIAYEPGVEKTSPGGEKTSEKLSLDAWEFKEDEEGWGRPNKLSIEGVSNGWLKLEITGGDPYIYSPPAQIDASVKKYVVLRMKSDKTTSAQLYWITEDDRKWAEDKVSVFGMRSGTEEYTVNLESPTWKGTVVGLRLDPGSGPDGKIEIDYLRILALAQLPPKLQINPLSLIMEKGKNSTGKISVSNEAGNFEDGILELDLPQEFNLIQGEKKIRVSSLKTGEHKELWTIGTDKTCARVIRVIIDSKQTGKLIKEIKAIATNQIPDEKEIFGKPTIKKVNQDFVMGNKNLRLVFPGNDFGYGVFAVDANKDGKWKRMAVSLSLSYLTVRKGKEDVSQFIHPKIANILEKGIEFKDIIMDGAGIAWDFSFTLVLVDDDKIKFDYRATPRDKGELLYLQGPTFYVGEGSFGSSKDEAQFCGLEWLEKNEPSSSDISCHIPEQYIRFAPRPNKITIPLMTILSEGSGVALYWDCLQKWDGKNDLPSAVFASPNFVEGTGNHLMGLFLPTIPEYVRENELKASNPYVFKADTPFKIEAYLAVLPQTKTSLDALDKYFETFGIPDPAPIPHGDYYKELDFSMRAFTETLWRPQENKWLLQFACFPPEGTGFLPQWILHLKMASIASKDKNLKDKYEKMAGLTANLAGMDVPTDPFASPIDRLSSLASSASGLMKEYTFGERREDGSYRHKSGKIKVEKFSWWDYSLFGKETDTEIGICAQPLIQILKYVRISGDKDMFKEAEKTLKFMERFSIPFAGELSNFHVHTANILAAKWAVDAYLEAYRYTEDKHYLDKAIYWAKAGIPFLYVWNPPSPKQAIMLRYASTPDYGSEFFKGGGAEGSWIGYPVQWEGARYAYSLLQLADYDSTLPWKKIAEGTLISGMYQQVQDGEDDANAGQGGRTSNAVAMLPDWINPNTWEKHACMAPDGTILPCVYKIIGRDFEPKTFKAKKGEETLYITTRAEVSDILWDNDKLNFTITFPEGESGYVLIACIDKPGKVVLDGKELAENANLKKPGSEGWRHSLNWLEVKVPSTKAILEIQNAKYKYATRWTKPGKTVTAIDFDFKEDADGWAPSHHLNPFVVKDGILKTSSFGVDPYMNRTAVKIELDTIKKIKIRMKSSGGTGAQFFWATEDSPKMSEDKSISFSLKPGSEFQEYVLDVGSHEKWKGKRIVEIRLDPSGGPGTEKAEYEIDYIKGE